MASLCEIYMLSTKKLVHQHRFAVQKLKCTKRLTWCQKRWFHQAVILWTESRERRNKLNIQMLTTELHKQIFSNLVDKPGENEIDVRLLETVKKHLQKHNLTDKDHDVLPDVNLKLPKLQGDNIDEHFSNLAQNQVDDYKKLSESLMNNVLPSKPQEWKYAKGWTKYGSDNIAEPVDFPEEMAIVFDIECLVKEGGYPTMATALSPKHWYSWCSDHLVEEKFRWTNQPQLEDLIPLETKHGSNRISADQSVKRLVIGHNVGFDRSFVKEQYYIQRSKLRFVDTMSMHIAVCGLTNFQRILYVASNKNSSRKEIKEWLEKGKLHGDVHSEGWKEVSTMNNLRDVYHLHCGGEPLDKSERDVFMEGNMTDVRQQFQDLMSYCARDVEATLKVFRKLWPEFNERFQHPITLAGILEMGTAYLPTNQNWQHYISQSNATYDDLQRELKLLLMGMANDACELLHDQRYKDDPWLWDLDWSVADMRMKKIKKKTNIAHKGEIEIEEETVEDRIENVLSTKEHIPKRPTHMPGYPQWFKDLCPKVNSEEWSPGPSLISPQVRVTPKLLRLTWDGFPMHYSDKHGWGYVVPSRAEGTDFQIVELMENNIPQYPVRAVYELCGETWTDSAITAEEYERLLNQHRTEDSFKHLPLDDGMDIDELRKHWRAAGQKAKKFKSQRHNNSHQQHIGDGPYSDVEIPGCLFYKIPHKDGKGKRVGNPLAKDYLSKVEDGVLKACSGASADRALRLSKMCSYWKNNQDRIESQMNVWLKKSELSRITARSSDFDEDCQYGAIIPRIVTAGTITRRAVERTWLTASNAYSDRIGSELKAMIQSPPGYCFVGADVDSQELWIAAIIGDSHFAKIHGCTAFGWMTLQGRKSARTDLHSKTAELVGISRDHAKVFNYGRIYGAGQRFAERLLMQFNHRLTEKDARDKAKTMYMATKGRKVRLKTNSDIESSYKTEWEGGSESAMFNKLEEIARAESPRTPVLGCRISKALEPRHVNEDFMTSRVNWVVQSSAVDYLHLMLVNMNWLFTQFGIDGRFCISIHDEVRYIVKSEDRYRAALALQITNLLTRCMFSYKLGMQDLPMSVAFFSAVDIDTCLRKEVTMDCQTPSNPQGLERGYNIPIGEALDIHSIMEKTSGSLQHQKKNIAAK